MLENRGNGTITNNPGSVGASRRTSAAGTSTSTSSTNSRVRVYQNGVLVNGGSSHNGVFTGSNIVTIGDSTWVDGSWTYGPVTGAALNVVNGVVSGIGSVFYNAGSVINNDPSTNTTAGSSTPGPGRAFRTPNDSSQAHLIATAISDIIRETNPDYDSALSPVEKERLKQDPPKHFPPNFADVAGILYRAIVISNDQMWNEVLSAKFNINVADFTNAWTSSQEKEWQSMDTKEQWAAIGRAKTQWAMTVEEMSSTLGRDDKFQEHGVAHFNQRFDALRKQFDEHASIYNVSTAVHAALNFFVDFSALVSDVTYVLNHAFKPNLIELKGLPDRAVVLVEILQRVPRDIELESAIKTTLFDLPDKNADCAICLSRLGEDIDVKALRALQRECVGKPGYLSWITLAGNNTTAFKIKDGLSGVPVKMKCIHHFCAGCINKWLGSAGKLQCPFRDQDYGVHRSPTVAEMETLCREYHYSDRRAGVGGNVRDDQVGLLTRLLRVLRLA